MICSVELPLFPLITAGCIFTTRITLLDACFVLVHLGGLMMIAIFLGWGLRYDVLMVGHAPLFREQDLRELSIFKIANSRLAKVDHIRYSYFMFD